MDVPWGEGGGAYFFPPSTPRTLYSVSFSGCLDFFLFFCWVKHVMHGWVMGFRMRSVWALNQGGGKVPRGSEKGVGGRGIMKQRSSQKNKHQTSPTPPNPHLTFIFLENKHLYTYIGLKSSVPPFDPARARYDSPVPEACKLASHNESPRQEHIEKYLMCARGRGKYLKEWNKNREQPRMQLPRSAARRKENQDSRYSICQREASLEIRKSGFGFLFIIPDNVVSPADPRRPVPCGRSAKYILVGVYCTYCGLNDVKEFFSHDQGLEN